MKFLFLFLPLIVFASTTKESLIIDLRSFIKASKPNRIVGSAGHKSCRAYLKNILLNNGARLEVQTFKPDLDVAKKLYFDDFKSQIKGKYPKDSKMYKKWSNFTGYMSKEIDKLKNVNGENIIWIKTAKNESKKWLILMAHYDSISHHKDSLNILYNDVGPGADYNGTGVVSLLNISKRLKRLNLKNNVLILFADYHGFSFLGAHHFVKDMHKYVPKGSEVAIFNVEMIGHDTKALDKTKKFLNYKIYTRKKNKKDDAHIDILLKYNKSCKGSLFFDLIKNDFNNSDHVRFWENDFGAITFSQNWEDDFNSMAYQSKSDIVETINQNSYFQAHKYISCISTNFLTR
jgi:hypothetical protein